jgi:E3 ubiquitin ligase SMURF1/2/E3 ubiquitin-protein ligase HUWE1
MPFQHKEAWFRQQIAKLQVPWEDGHIKINVRRENLLEDSMEATESITQADMRKIFRFEFIAEPGTRRATVKPLGSLHLGRLGKS